MSERWGVCKPCAGWDCPSCQGSGFTGGAFDTLAPRFRPIDPAVSQKGIEDAILAVENFVKREENPAPMTNIIPFGSIKNGEKMTTQVEQQVVNRAQTAPSPTRPPSSNQPHPHNRFMSATIGKLAQALAMAQSEIQHATKDKDNPFFKSTYADLASVWDACRGPLSKNNLCVVQPYEIVDGKVILITQLLHSSGEWILSTVPVIPTKQDPQGMGSAMTYMRRFALSSLVGVAPVEKVTESDGDDDDDGEAASGRGRFTSSPQKGLDKKPVAKAPAPIASHPFAPGGKL